MISGVEILRAIAQSDWKENKIWGKVINAQSAEKFGKALMGRPVHERKKRKKRNKIYFVDRQMKNGKQTRSSAHIRILKPLCFLSTGKSYLF